MKKIFIGVFVFFMAGISYSQYFTILTEFQENYLFLNPALPHQEFLFTEHSHGIKKQLSVGSSFRTTVGVSYRKQWHFPFFDDSNPETGLVRLEQIFPINYSENISRADRMTHFIIVGGMILKDKTLPTSLISFHGRLAYRMRKNGFAMGVGFSAVRNAYRFDGDPDFLVHMDDPIGLGELNNDNKPLWGVNGGVMAEGKLIDDSRYDCFLTSAYSLSFLPEMYHVPKTRNFLYHQFLVGWSVVNKDNLPLIRSWELLTWVRYIHDDNSVIPPNLPISTAINLRLNFDLGGQNGGDHNYLWLGFGTNLSFSKNNIAFTNLHFSPSFVIRGGVIDFKLGFAFSFYPRNFQYASRYNGFTYEFNGNLTGNIGG